MKQFMAPMTLLLGMVLLAGCVPIAAQVGGTRAPAPAEKIQMPGPPPHAPAHGYRHKHRDGVELEFDSTIDAYVVIGLPGIYFHNDLYIRMSSSGVWEVSVNLGGPWGDAEMKEVPPKLKKKKEHPGKSKGRGHEKKW